MSISVKEKLIPPSNIRSSAYDNYIFNCDSCSLFVSDVFSIVEV